MPLWSLQSNFHIFWTFGWQAVWFFFCFFGWIDGLHGNQRHPLGRILSVSKTPEHLELENVTRASFKKVVRNKWVKFLMLDELSLYLTNPLIYLVWFPFMPLWFGKYLCVVTILQQISFLWKSLHQTQSHHSAGPWIWPVMTRGHLPLRPIAVGGLVQRWAGNDEHGAERYSSLGLTAALWCWILPVWDYVWTRDESFEPGLFTQQ